MGVQRAWDTSPILEEALDFHGFAEWNLVYKYHIERSFTGPASIKRPVLLQLSIYFLSKVLIFPIHLPFIQHIYIHLYPNFIISIQYIKFISFLPLILFFLTQLGNIEVHFIVANQEPLCDLALWITHGRSR